MMSQLPERLQRTGDSVRQRPRGLPMPVTIDTTPEMSPVMRSTMQARLRHQRRMDHLLEARAITWLVFGVICCLIAVVVGVLVAGAMFGAWDLPIGQAAVFGVR